MPLDGVQMLLLLILEAAEALLEVLPEMEHLAYLLFFQRSPSLWVSLFCNLKEFAKLNIFGYIRLKLFFLRF